jgi:hypothetical protein
MSTTMDTVKIESSADRMVDVEIGKESDETTVTTTESEASESGVCTMRRTLRYLAFGVGSVVFLFGVIIVASWLSPTQETKMHLEAVPETTTTTPKVAVEDYYASFTTPSADAGRYEGQASQTFGVMSSDGMFTNAMTTNSVTSASGSFGSATIENPTNGEAFGVIESQFQNNAPTGPVVANAAYKCGCSACTEEVLNTVILPVGRTCGDWIDFYPIYHAHETATEQEACRRVAFEYPYQCAMCDPSRCGLRAETFEPPSEWVPPVMEIAPRSAPAPKVAHEMYCFPPEGQRTTYPIWGGMELQVKESGEGLCGPGWNGFSSDTVKVAGDELTLMYANKVGSEVRVTLPNNQLFTYGTYSFSVKSVAVYDKARKVIDNMLPKDLVLGLFSWDDTEDYASHENWNHEVDIEISRWNVTDNADVQFLTQPPGFPQMYRFFSGEEGGTYDQGGHVYEFTWLPNRIDWNTNAGGGQTFSLTTERSLFGPTADLVQCMPSGNTEMRLNLWNMAGAFVPDGLRETDTVEVVIDDFSFIPSKTLFAKDGDYCSKHCQCATSSLCMNGICTAQ